MSTYRECFPDFDPSTMVVIPADWKDMSFRNDNMPFFLISPALGVFIDYADPAQREFPNKRFMVVQMEDGEHPDDADEPLLETDDWAEVLDFVASAEARS